uniref:Uncharacterized protein n=1 Tax=Arundo donax TaxID=35708 RepID=A0A0A8ZFH2_ARUDO
MLLLLRIASLRTANLMGRR